MKNIEQIKQELINFGEKYSAYEEILNSIKGDTLTSIEIPNSVTSQFPSGVEFKLICND